MRVRTHRAPYSSSQELFHKMEDSQLEIRLVIPPMAHTKPHTHSPAGIMRDRALVEDDLGMLVCGLGEVKWLIVSADGLLAVSGLSPPSGRDISWSRCSEKLPAQTQKKSVTALFLFNSR